MAVCTLGAGACAEPSSEGGGLCGASPTRESEGGGGAGGEGSPCALDCAAIVAPACYVARCEAETGACVIVPGPAGEPCDDGLFCTADDACEEGQCLGRAPNHCGLTAEACEDIVCDEASRRCAVEALPDGAACSVDDDLCVVQEACLAGECVGTPRDCFFAPMPDDCHVGVCEPSTGECVPAPGHEGAPCPDDGDLCAVNKTCAAGLCQGGTPKDCSPFSTGCANGMCDPSTGDCVTVPVAPGGPCAQGDGECTTGVCDASGVCAPVPTPGLSCASATDACNTGVCDASGACAPTPTNDGAGCDDGNTCTIGEVCAAGACQSGLALGYQVYFSESFASNAAGWTLGSEWQIGKATASIGSIWGAQDPAQDHSTSDDDGLAGVVIGGYPAKSVHPSSYLTSPPFDTSGAPGSVFLELYRWLNSDYAPFMNNTIDVFDGLAWVNVWTSGAPPAVQDNTWAHVSFDVTAHKNAAMRVRFGFEVGSASAFTVSGWNLDDVVVANQICGD